MSSSCASRTSRSRTWLDDHRRQSLGRLVHHQQARIAEQRARDRQHLLLAARKLAAAVVAALGEAREGRVDALDRPVAAVGAGARRQPQRLVDRQARPQPAPLRHIADAGARDLVRLAPENVLALEAHRRPSARAITPDDRVAQRRLAHAVAADDRQHAALQRQRHALQRVRLAVIDLQVLHLQDRLAAAAALIHARPRDRAPEPRRPPRSRSASPP